YNGETNIQITASSVIAVNEGFTFVHQQTPYEHVIKITGDNFYANVPVSVPIQPTEDNHLTNKSYVDDQIDAIKTDGTVYGALKAINYYNISNVTQTGTPSQAYVDIDLDTYTAASYNIRHDATLEIIDSYGEVN